VCPHAGACGGCAIISLPYADQLARKHSKVVLSLARYPALSFVNTEPVVPAETRAGYRTRAKLMVAPGAKLGLFAKGGGHRVVDVPQCRILAPAIERVSRHLRGEIAKWERSGGPLVPFDPQGAGGLRAVDLRETRDEGPARVLVTLVVQRERGRAPDLEQLRDAASALLAANPDVIGVAVNFHVGDAPQVLGAETVLLAGAPTAPDRIGPSTHLATFGSFVQAHRAQAERIHTILAEAIAFGAAKRPRVLDLYGGSGAIALGLATRGAKVHLIEAFEPATAQARASARAQALDVEVQCADVALALADLARRGEHFDAAVVNPPRRGTSPAARESLAILEPPLIAYVSCNPETLARDLDHFARLGYAAARLRPLDMIPLTDEVETIALLRHGGIPVPRVVYEDEDVFIVEKGPHEPTVPQGEYRSSLLARARRLPGARQCLALCRLDVGTSGLVVLARRSEALAPWERALSQARTTYLAAVRGVTPLKGSIVRDLHDDGRRAPARTRYRRLGMATGQSILRVVLDHPSRAHQVRRHLAGVGHPVLGDDRYGHAPTNRHYEEKHGLDRLFLHCMRLEFKHPRTGADHLVEAPLAGDLRTVLERVTLPGTLRYLDAKNALGPNGAPPIPPRSAGGTVSREGEPSAQAKSTVSPPAGSAAEPQLE
jgi:23S rRNA (uracil1939-C5)-methyltransferase